MTHDRCLISNANKRVKQNNNATSEDTTAEQMTYTNNNTPKEAQKRDDEPSNLTPDDSSTSTSSRQTEPGALVPQDPITSRMGNGDLLPQILELIHDEMLGETRWNDVIGMVEADPNLARRQVPILCQGENSTGFLIHYLMSSRRQKPTPVAVLDALTTANPKALSYPDPRGGRLPLHMAVFLPFCSATCLTSRVELVKYLAEAYPQALQVRDKEGNLPLHYATMLHGSDMVHVLLKPYPQACSVRNSRDRYPLHLLCDRYLDNGVIIHQDVVQACVDACPSALEGLDRFGRTPLHLACNVQHLWRWDILEVLIKGYPQALLMKDKVRKTPLALAKRHGQSNFHKKNNKCADAALTDQYNLVLSSLAECTTREKRKNSFGFASWMHSTSSSQSSTNTTMILKNPPQKRKGSFQQKPQEEVNLYNCYG